MTPARALRRAQQWLRAATSTDVDAFVRRSTAAAPATRDLGPADEGAHGPSSDEHPFAHLYHWAPFVFVGA